MESDDITKYNHPIQIVEFHENSNMHPYHDGMCGDLLVYQHNISHYKAKSNVDANQNARWKTTKKFAILAMPQTYISYTSTAISTTIMSG